MRVVPSRSPVLGDVSKDTLVFYISSTARHVTYGMVTDHLLEIEHKKNGALTVDLLYSTLDFIPWTEHQQTSHPSKRWRG